MLTHKGTQTIETGRLILRRFAPEDAEPMYRNWASDSEVTKFLTWPPHASPEVSAGVVRDWVAGYEKDDFYQWAIVLRENRPEPVGSISVVSHNDKVASACIGYCIGRPWWHRGVMTEALGAVMDFLFDEVGMERVESQHDPRNPHSGGVMKNCGMKYEGTHRRSDWSNQGVCDTCWYALLKEERGK